MQGVQHEVFEGKIPSNPNDPDKSTKELTEAEVNEELDNKVSDFAEAKILDALRIPSKAERYDTLSNIKALAVDEFGEEDNGDLKKEIASAVDSIKKKTMRNFIISPRYPEWMTG